jgi:hypothetical protein
MSARVGRDGAGERELVLRRQVPVVTRADAGQESARDPALPEAVAQVGVRRVGDESVPRRRQPDALCGLRHDLVGDQGREERLRDLGRGTGHLRPPLGRDGDHQRAQGSGGVESFQQAGQGLTVEDRGQRLLVGLEEPDPCAHGVSMSASRSALAQARVAVRCGGPDRLRRVGPARLPRKRASPFAAVVRTGSAGPDRPRSGRRDHDLVGDDRAVVVGARHRSQGGAAGYGGQGHDRDRRRHQPPTSERPLLGREPGCVRRRAIGHASSISPTPEQSLCSS